MNWRSASRRSIPYLVAVTAGFLLAYAIVAMFIFPARLISSEHKVPNVVGLTLDGATRELSKAGLTFTITDKVYSATAAPGMVLTQMPPPGSIEAPDAAVKLELSLGQRTGEVPMVVGLSQPAAELAIENAGFGLGQVTEQRTDSVPRGEVMASTPAAGTRVSIPSGVALVVSSGPATLRVPDVVGQSLGQARALLDQVGLKLGDVVQDSASTALPNTVTAQSPAANQTVPAGSAVRLTVAAQPVTVPPLAPPAR